MIETYKHQDGEALGANKVGEGNGENEGKIGDISEPPQTPAPPVFPPQTDNFQKPIKFKSDLGNEFFRKKGEKPSEEKPEPKKNPKPKPKLKPFHYEHCGREGHLAEFCFRRSVRRGWLESWPARTGATLLMVCLSLSWCREAWVWCVPFTLERGVSLCLVESNHI
jgi:hypothetical protein